MISYLATHQILVVFLAAWVTTDAFTWIVRQLAARHGWLDKPAPNGHKQHAMATPTLGGVAMSVGFLVALGITVPSDPILGAILVTGGGIVLTGAFDDLFGVSAVIKLAVLAVATTVLVLHGISLHLVGVPVLDGVLTFLWIGFVSSAFNGLDNSDGAAAGVGAIVGAVVAAIAWASWQLNLARLAIALTGCCLGFLRHNFNPARIFMGDSGSFFLGYVVASILVYGRWAPDTVQSCLIPLVIMAVPIFDFMLILVCRGLDGKYKRWVDPIVMCARDHTAHRLQEMGLQVRGAVLAIYLLSVCAAAAALMMFNATPLASYVICGAFLTLLGSVAVAFRIVELQRRPPVAPAPPQTSPPRPVEVLATPERRARSGELRPRSGELRPEAIPT